MTTSNHPRDSRIHAFFEAVEALSIELGGLKNLLPVNDSSAKKETMLADKVERSLAEIQESLEATLHDAVKASGQGSLSIQTSGAHPLDAVALSRHGTGMRELGQRFLSAQKDIASLNDSLESRLAQNMADIMQIMPLPSPPLQPVVTVPTNPAPPPAASKKMTAPKTASFSATKP